MTLTSSPAGLGPLAVSLAASLLSTFSHGIVPLCLERPAWAGQAHHCPLQPVRPRNCSVPGAMTAQGQRVPGLLGPRSPAQQRQRLGAAREVKHSKLCDLTELICSQFLQHSQPSVVFTAGLGILRVESFYIKSLTVTVTWGPRLNGNTQNQQQFLCCKSEQEASF